MAEECIALIRTVVAFEGQQVEIKRFNQIISRTRKLSYYKGILLGSCSALYWILAYILQFLEYTGGART